MWVQLPMVKHVPKGGNKTNYFKIVANCKYMRKPIFKTEQDE